jgi:hypothetical protein
MLNSLCFDVQFHEPTEQDIIAIKQLEKEKEI